MSRSTVLLAVVSSLLAPASLLSQTTRGSIVGTISDPSGAVVADAVVTTTQIETGFTYRTTSNADGNYVAPSLLPGRYRIEVEKSGFQTRTVEPIEVNVDARVQVNVQLNLQGTQQTVVITGEGPMVEGDSASLGQVIRRRAIVDLPLNGRNFLQLALLSSGAVPLAQATSDTAGFNRPSINISGGRESSNQFTIDGVFNNALHFEGLNIQLSIDAIQEFKVQRNTFSAEFGQGTAIVNVASRSGTNRFHGTVYEFLRNDVLDARQFFDAATPPYRQNQFGFTFGGPVFKDKTFFFLNYEGFRSRRANTLVATLPTAQQLSGNFAGSPAIRDPLTGEPFPGNIIPTSRFSPLTGRILPFLPTVTSAGANNYQIAPSTANDFDQFTVRLDHRFSERDSFFGRFTYADLRLYNPGLIRMSGSAVTDIPQNGVLQWTHNFSPTLLNELRFGFNRNLQNRLQEGANGENILQFTNISTDPLNFGLPLVAITGYSGFGTVPTTPEIVGGNTFQYDDSLTWIRGNHTLKFGADIRFLQFPHLPFLFGRGQYVFAGAVTGNPVADFLVGYPLVSIGAGRGPTAFMSIHQANAFVQDDWKVAPAFTLNFGLRYERTGIITDRFRARLGVFDERSGEIVRGTDVDSRGLVNPDNNNFGPRLGFAWQPFRDTRTVIRGGYGLYYDVKPVNELNFSLGTELGFRQIVSPAQSWDALFPAAGTSAGVGILTDDPFARTPYVQQYSFGVQREVVTNLVVEANYTGSQGRKLNRRMDLNQGVLPSTPGQPLAGRQPYAGLGAIVMAKNIANSNYNALGLRAEKRFSQNLSFLAVYTWSKSHDTSSLAGDTTSGAAGIPQNRLDEKAEYGLSAFDQRHRFVLSYIYALPFGAGQRFMRGGGLANVLFGGWQLNGITTLSTGNPFTVQVNGTDRSQTGAFGGGNQRANVVAGQQANLPPDQRTVQRWFNTAAFAVAPPGTFGNAGRNIVTGPGTNNWDFSLFKNTRVKEEATLEFRAEFFNIFNHAQFLLPVADPTSQAFGRITSVRPAREIQFGLKFIF